MLNTHTLLPPKQLYRLKHLDRVEGMARQVSNYFPRPAHVTTGIYELLINGIEHGNLEIGFSNKTKLIHQGKWHDEVVRRQALPKYSDREVEIVLECTNEHYAVHISDQGKGFNWKYYLDGKVPENLPNGRGLRIVSATGFSEILFNQSGNGVTCIVNRT